MRIKTLLLSLLSWLFCSISYAQSTPNDIVNKFFELYKKEGSDKAIDYIFATNKYAKESIEAIGQLKDNLKKTLTIEGVFWGYELLTTKRAGQNFIMLTFLVKHERDPLTFRIVFYKPNDKWQVQNFKFDNKMDEELEEASKNINLN
mgnify:CR=1 FL=1|jgi:hypothetical protein